MPIFNFTCSKCGKTFETLLKNRSEQAECPACGSTEVTAAPNRISVGRSNSNSCPNQALCPGAAASGCGCASSCCGHKH
ncbi:MAG: zinc ribbon domain-containing protein [Lentisphaeria bacterium]|nr:zinc ribbon domain-containing protein [Lentisphaeria bacterium]